MVLHNKPARYSKERGQVLGIIHKRKRLLNIRENVKNGAEMEERANNSGAATSTEIPGRVVESIGALFDVYVKQNGSAVNYEGLAYSKEYTTFLSVARELPEADFSGLGESDLKGFYINLYNVMIIHSIIEIGAPRNMWARLKMYGTSAYQVGPHVLSLNDIENGILRGNRGGVAPCSSEHTFLSNDNRVKLVLPRDPRIHCALNCGAVSCPSIRLYEFGKVEEQLEEATQEFLFTQNIQEGAIMFSVIFKWFEKDFGSSDSEVIAWMLAKVGDRVPNVTSALENLMSQIPSLKLRYETYNWDLNSYKS